MEATTIDHDAMTVVTVFVNNSVFNSLKHRNTELRVNDGILSSLSSHRHPGYRSGIWDVHDQHHSDQQPGKALATTYNDYPLLSIFSL